MITDDAAYSVKEEKRAREFWDTFNKRVCPEDLNYANDNFLSKDKQLFISNCEEEKNQGTGFTLIKIL